MTSMRARSRASSASTFRAPRRCCPRTCRAPAACGSPIGSTPPPPRTAPRSQPSGAASPSIRCSATRTPNSMPPSSPGSAAPTTRSASAWPGRAPASPNSTTSITKPMTVGGTGGGADTDVFPQILNAVLGTKMKVIAGYPGGNDVNLAMERGEVQGRCGWSWSSVLATHKDWLDAKEDHRPGAAGAVQASGPAGCSAGHRSRQDRRAAANPQADLRPPGDGPALSGAARPAARTAPTRCARRSWTPCRTRSSWPRPTPRNWRSSR